MLYQLEALCEEKSLRCEKLKQEVDMLEGMFFWLQFAFSTTF